MRPTMQKLPTPERSFFVVKAKRVNPPNAPPVTKNAWATEVSV